MYIKVEKRVSAEGTSGETRPSISVPNISVQSTKRASNGPVREKVMTKGEEGPLNRLLLACSAAVPITQPQKCQQCVRFHFPEFLCQHLQGR